MGRHMARNLLTGRTHHAVKANHDIAVWLVDPAIAIKRYAARYRIVSAAHPILALRYVRIFGQWPEAKDGGDVPGSIRLADRKV